MPSDTFTSTHPSPIARGARLLSGGTREQHGLAIAALLTFFGVAYLGPALTRLTTPRTRAERLRAEAAYQAESLRRRARKSGAKVRDKARKRVRRLGGGTIGPR